MTRKSWKSCSQETLNNRKNGQTVPTVLRIGPYRFFFVSIDYAEPPHIHVRREDHVAKFWLDPIVLQEAGGFSRTELNKIASVITENLKYMLERWHEYFGN